MVLKSSAPRWRARYSWLVEGIGSVILSLWLTIPWAENWHGLLVVYCGSCAGSRGVFLFTMDQLILLIPLQLSRCLVVNGRACDYVLQLTEGSKVPKNPC